MEKVLIIFQSLLEFCVNQIVSINVKKSTEESKSNKNIWAKESPLSF